MPPDDGVVTSGPVLIACCLAARGFRPRYVRVVREQTGRHAADRELIRRRRRHRALHPRPIGPRGQSSYALSWRLVQESFADDPLGALDRGEPLVGKWPLRAATPPATTASGSPCSPPRTPLAHYRRAGLICARARTEADTTGTCADNRDERFATGLFGILGGLESARRQSAR